MNRPGWTSPQSVFIWLILLAGLFTFPSFTRAAVVKVDVIQSQDRYPAGGSYPILLRIRIAEPWYLHGTKESGSGLIPTVLSFQASDGLRMEKIQFPEPEKKRFEYTKEPIDVFSGEILVRAILAVGETASEGENSISGELFFQACSSRSCLPPQKLPVRLTVRVSPKGAGVEFLNRSYFGSQKGFSATEGLVGLKIAAGLWLTLLGIFLGGLALNLTPCVYPLIPITVSYFGGKSKKVSGRSILHGLLYISGLGLTNSLLGVTAALTGGMLGAALQNPFFLVLVAGILVYLGLSFFGFWELRLPSGLTRLASKNFGGYFGTFFMGLTLGIVAAPCLGPFILGLLTYVGQQGDPYLGFLYFFVLSIGLGIPLAALGVFSGALDRLPMSGAWMVWIRKCLGWVLFGMAGYMLLPLVPGHFWESVLISLLLLAAGLHLGWIERTVTQSGIFWYAKKTVGILLVGSAVLFSLTSLKTVEGIQWVPYTEKALAKAAEEKKPVILDFYADWCVPCRELDIRVFGDPEVIKLSRRFLTLRVDLTGYNTHQERLQKRYHIRGVPTLIFIDKIGREEKALRIESYVDRNEFLKIMKQALKE